MYCTLLVPFPPQTGPVIWPRGLAAAVALLLPKPTKQRGHIAVENTVSLTCPPIFGE